MEEKKDSRNNIIWVFAAVFGFALLFQIFVNFIPSIIEGSQSKADVQKAETVQEDIKNHLEDALKKYKDSLQETSGEDVNEAGTDLTVAIKGPKSFSEFVGYKENVPEGKTFSLEQFEEYFTGKSPVEGLDSKKLVITLKDPKTKKEITAVYLLNQNYINLTVF
ncbi:MAG: hypothetical protein AB1782_07380 [Cyanobacteriota bacterium]